MTTTKHVPANRSSLLSRIVRAVFTSAGYGLTGRQNAPTHCCCFATIQINTRTVYGIGETPERSRDDAAEHGMTCAREDGDECCTHTPGSLTAGYATVPCTPTAAAYVRDHGGQPSEFLSVSRSGVCLRDEEAKP